MKNVVLGIFISISIASCSKENSDQFVPYSNNPLNDTVWVEQPSSTASVNNIQELFAVNSKNDSVDIASGATIRFSEFIDITFPPFFAHTIIATPVTGKVNVEVVHLRKKGDMIRFARPTTSYGKILEMGGAFLIRVTKEGQELVMALNKSITIHVRDNSAVTNMQVFYGEQKLQLPLPVGTNPNFTWVPGTGQPGTVNVFTKQDANGTSYKGYEIFSKRFNSVSIAHFIDASQPKTPVTALLPANFTNNNTAVFAVFKEQKIVVQLIGELASRSFFAPNIPLGKKINIISISKIGDDFFVGSKEVSVENNIRVTVAPERKTKAQVDQFLDAL